MRTAKTAKTTKATRTKQVNFRCSPKEFTRIERVASHHGLSLAAVIRMLVKREALAIKAAKER